MQHSARLRSQLKSDLELDGSCRARRFSGDGLHDDPVLVWVVESLHLEDRRAINHIRLAEGHDLQQTPALDEERSRCRQHLKRVQPSADLGARTRRHPTVGLAAGGQDLLLELRVLHLERQ